MNDGKVVRYIGMIQDIFNPEYFCSSYRVKDKATETVTIRNGIYRDLIYCIGTEELIEDGSEMSNQAARHPLFCIPVPGQNKWAVQGSPLNQAGDSDKIIRSKRAHEGEEVVMKVVETKNVRRRAETSNIERRESPSTECDAIEKYFPLGEINGLACIVKHYGEYEDWLLNTKIEAVGFLSVSPELELCGQGSDAEDRATHPPPSLIPRIHALRIRKLPSSYPFLSGTSTDLGMDINEARSDLITTLTQLLYGDTLAAEYLLCQLLSSVYVRTEGRAVGALSLNLFNVHHAPAFPQLMFQFLQTLLPFSSYLPLSIDLLNNYPFLPKKDYETNRLWSGRLQLADATHLLINEMSMTEGKLLEPGVRNMAALHSLSLRQSLNYDFTYFQLDFNTNIPAVVVSQGKSIIPTNIVVKVLPENGTASNIPETFEAAQFFLSGPRLAAVRKYLLMIRMREFQMDATDFVGPAWASLRQNDSKLTQDDLHNLLVLTRLIAISEGKTGLTVADWNRAVQMENTRRARIASL